MSGKILAQEVVTSIDLLSAWIESQMAYRDQPGLSIGIVYDQELVWAQGFGLADVEEQVPATPQTIYRIASITKLFTATAVLQLRDAGKLQLDDPIQKHLPWFTIREKYPDAPPITIRHLLTHTSGLPREANFPYWTDSDFPTMTQIQEALPQQETILWREERFKYSNLGLTLAGEIVAAVSKQPYVDYIQQHILDLLDMVDTHVQTIDPDHPQLATGYGRRLPGNQPRQISPFTDSQGLTPAFNIASTVEDLAKFAMLQFGGDAAGNPQILRGSTLREMRRVHWLAPNWQTGRGLGFYIVRQENKTYVGHGGAVQGHRTLFMLCPEEKTAVIILTNADDGEPLHYAEKVNKWVTPAIVKAMAPEPETAVQDPAWQAYLGKYRDAWGDLQILIHDDQLIALNPSLPDPDPGLIKLIPVARHTFRMETENGFGAPGEQLVFEMDTNGQVERIKFGMNYMYPIAEW